jgi:hypothetical protein
VFNVVNGTVTISGLTIRNGQQCGQAGAAVSVAAFQEAHLTLVAW